MANSGTNGLLRTAGGVMEAPSLSWSDLSSSGTGGRGTPLPLEKRAFGLKNCFQKVYQYEWIVVGEVCQNPCGTAMQGRHATKP